MRATLKPSSIQAIKQSSIQAIKHSSIQAIKHSGIQAIKHSSIQKCSWWITTYVGKGIFLNCSNLAIISTNNIST